MTNTAEWIRLIRRLTSSSKKNSVKNADILGSSDRKQADLFLWKDSRYTPEQYKEWFGTRKPCIKGGNTHDANDEIGRLKDQELEADRSLVLDKGGPYF